MFLICARLIWSCVFCPPFNKSNITKSVIGWAIFNIKKISEKNVNFHRAYQKVLYIGLVKFKNDSIMEKIKNKTLYINITTQNKQHEVREARLVSLISTFENISWDSRLTEPDPMVGYVKPSELKLEIAGMGVVGKSQIDALCGLLYLTEEDACTQTSNCIYKYNWEDFYIRWANIMFNNLHLRNNKFSLVRNTDKCYLNFYAKSWFWDGTKPCGRYFAQRFQFDFVNNVSVEYSDYENGKFNQQKLYATKEMCEHDNKPIIVRFDNKPKQVEKIVTFEITTMVKVNANDMPECEEEDAIIKAMNNIRTCDDEVLFGACVSCSTYPNKKQ